MSEYWNDGSKKVAPAPWEVNLKCEGVGSGKERNEEDGREAEL